MIRRQNRIFCPLIPKTGSGTVRRLLGVKHERHRKYIKLPNKTPDGKVWPKPFDFCFAFVRNPWSRLVSSWFFGRQGYYLASSKVREENNYCDLFFKYPLFKDFVKGVNDSEDSFKDFSQLILFKPQLYWMDNAPEDFNFIGKFENFNEDLKKVFNLMKVNMNKDIAKQKTNNTLKRKDWRFYYDDESIEIISKIYKKDIEYFKYKF